MSNKLSNIRAFKGATAFFHNESHMVFGSPSGLVQHLLKMENCKDKRELLVDTVFLSDLTVQSHTSQQDIEFIFFTAMFLGMDFANNQPCSMLYDFANGEIIKKFRVIVPEGREKNIYDQVEYTLFGARREFMKDVCKLEDDLIDILACEQEHWYIKNKGKDIVVEDLVDVLTYDANGKIVLDGIEYTMSGSQLTIKDDQSNLLDKFDIQFEGRIDPAWKVPVKKKAVDLSGISLIPLGTASPFNPDEPSTSYWLQIRGEGHFLIDCGFLTWQCFEANGGDLSQLRGMIITHGHGDHIDLTAYMNRSCKLELWTTTEIYEMAKRITCAKANIDPEDFTSHFTYVPIKASYPDKNGKITGESKFIDDLEIRFHYSIHSIPTIGVNLWKGGKKLVAFSSDMCDFETMYRLKDEKVVSKARTELIMERLSNEGHPDCWILLDCGGDGFIHGKIEGYLDYYQKKDKIVMCHREKRLPGEKLPARLSEPLSVYKIKAGISLARGTALITAYLSSLALHGNQHLSDWSLALSAEMELVHVPASTMIYEEGRRIGEEFYMISSGNCEIEFEGTDCGKLISGDSFGEQSFLPHDVDAVWNVSVRSLSPVSYYRLPASMMKALLNENVSLGGDLQGKLIDEMRYIHVIQLSILASKLNIPTRVFKDFVNKIEEKYYRKGKYLFKKGDHDDGHMYIVQSGTLGVRIEEGAEQVIIEKFSCVGENVASGKSAYRNADVITLEACILLKISHEAFFEIMNRIPSFSIRLKDIFQERA